MEWYRTVNFILQSSYLIIHLVFMLWLLKKRQPTPLWNWYIISAAAIWIWVLGRFLETIVYLFFSTNNAAYVFAANFQYIGNTTAVSSYLIWNMYLANYDKLASNPLFRMCLFLGPVITCVLVFTNQYHHLIYVKLDMGQRVIHGRLFALCVGWTYLMLIAGYLISVIYTLRAKKDIVKRIFMFSVFPGLPAVAAMVRCISGIDKLDYTPIFMAVSFYFLYLIVFQYNYTNLISSSVQSVIEQSTHPVWIYCPADQSFLYRNHIARQEFPELENRLMASALEPGSNEIAIGGKHLKIDISQTPKSESLIITASDVTEVSTQQAALERKVEELVSANKALEEQNRNYDAYLEILYQADGLKEKQERIAAMYQMLPSVFRQMANNFQTAKEHPDQAGEALKSNLSLSQTSIASIRETVAYLREG